MSVKPMNIQTNPEHTPTPFRGLENLLRLGLPVLPADEANERILELEIQVMQLQAEIDRQKFLKLWDES